MANLIRWKQSDFLQLGNAVYRFNKKIDKLQTEENKLYLPEKLNYSEIKSEIYTRQEFNRMLAMIRRFQKEDASELYENNVGEKMTKWEHKELNKLNKMGIKNLQKELEELNEPITPEGFSRIQMGSIREKEIKRSIEKRKNLENMKGYDFREFKKTIFRTSTSNFQMKKAIIFQKNYLEELKKYEKFDNYELLMEKIDKLNPYQFYEIMKQNEITKDLTYQSDNTYTQEAFNGFLTDLGIEIKIDSVSPNK